MGKVSGRPGPDPIYTEDEFKARRVQSTLNSRAKNKDRYNVYMSCYLTDLYRKSRAQVIFHLGAACTKCGFDADWRALQIDHVNGGGVSDRRSKSWKKYFDSVLTCTTGEYQLLCANCNFIKRYEKNEVLMNRAGKSIGDHLSELQLAEA